MSTNYGKAVVEPKFLTVGTKATWSLVYIVGRKGVLPRGGIKVGIIGRGCCERLQISNPKESEYVTVKSSCEECTVEMSEDMLRNGSQLWEVGCIVGNKPLKENDRIIVVYGDTSKGGSGFTVRKYCQKLRIFVLVDTDGTRNYVRLTDPPMLEYKADKAKKFILLAPSLIVKDSPFRVLIKAVDKYGNVADSYTGKTSILCPKNQQFLPKEIPFTPKNNGIRILEDIMVSNSGIYTLKIMGRKRKIEGISNPIYVLDKSPLLNYFWGDIHGQTLMSDGQLTPDEYYRYGRDEEMLDFCAITDHDTHMTRRDRVADDEYLLSPFWREPLSPWHIIKYETERFNQPGKFVTFLGYEWTASHKFTPRDMCFGHKNVYYLSDDEPMYSHIDPESNTPKKLYNLLRNKEAIVIPHHTSRPVSLDPSYAKSPEGRNVYGAGTDWNYHDEDLERLVEIYSKWGNSEYYHCPRPVIDSTPEGVIQRALRRGYKMGFVAGSDTHTSGPGSPFPEFPFLPYRSGLTCVLASELTRQEIFEALKNRHCYATTGERIYVEFTLNGKYIMGDDVKVTSKNFPRRFTVKVVGTENIEKAELVKNNEELYTYRGNDEIAEFKHSDEKPIKGTDYYYLRITQRNKEMAWSSPIWVSVG